MSAPAPTAERQKNFILQNLSCLDTNTQRLILDLVMREAPELAKEASSTGPGVDIDLDALCAADPEVLHQLYRIVHARREFLSRPSIGKG